MPPQRRWRAFCLLGLASLAAAGHGGEAVRYRDAQGIEIIGGRATLVPAPAPARPAPAPLAQQAASARWQIAPPEQQARDRERLAILRQEMANEMAAIDTSAHSPPARDAESTNRAREQLRRHQQNIRALNAEIRRITDP